MAAPTDLDKGISRQEKAWAVAQNTATTLCIQFDWHTSKLNPTWKVEPGYLDAMHDVSRHVFR